MTLQSSGNPISFGDIQQEFGSNGGKLGRYRADSIHFGNKTIGDLGRITEGGYLPFELRKDAADMSPEDMEAFRQFMIERQLREAEEEEMDSEKGIKMLDTILGMQEGGYLETTMHA